MRTALILITAISACSNGANHLGNPLLLPISGISTAIGNGIYGQRRAKVEVFVKSNHPALIAEIGDGGGSTLDQAFDLANVPASDRDAFVLQAQGDIVLYQNNPSALVTAFMVYGDN